MRQKESGFQNAGLTRTVVANEYVYPSFQCEIRVRKTT